MLQLQNEKEELQITLVTTGSWQKFYELNFTMLNKTWCYSYKTREKNYLQPTLVTTETPQNFNITILRPKKKYKRENISRNEEWPKA